MEVPFRSERHDVDDRSRTLLSASFIQRTTSESRVVWNFFPSHAVSSLTAIKHGQQGGAPMSFECDDCGNIGLSLRLNPISRCFVLEENHFDYDLCFTRRAVTCHVALSCSVSVPDFKSADMVVMQISGI